MCCAGLCWLQGKLTSALADEGVRWQTTADSMGTQTELLVGDVFLASACIAYYGAFTGAGQGRDEMLQGCTEEVRGRLAGYYTCHVPPSLTSFLPSAPASCPSLPFRWLPQPASA